jgi:hypothetical protein
LNWLWKAVKWMLWLILALLTVFVINLAYFRRRGPTSAQQAALDLAQSVVSRPEGRNAFALMRLFDKDISDEEVDRIAGEDVRFAEENGHLGHDMGKFPSESLPSLPALTPGSPLCRTQEADCLARVRENEVAVRAELFGHSRLRARAIRLEGFDYLLDEFPRLPNMPVAFANGAQRLRLSSLALAYVDGSRDEALAGACQNISAWRRFGRNNPSLIQTMIGVNYRDASLRLFADMLAELNPDDVIPQGCRSALAPPTAEETSSCASMLGEFTFMEAALAQMLQTGKGSEQDNWLRGEGESVFLSNPQSRAWRAVRMAVYCGEEAEANARNDQLVDASRNEIGLFECMSNPIGCVLGKIPAAAYSIYDRRMLDSAAHLRLAATLVWLREHRGGPGSSAIQFDERPPELRSGARASSIGEDGRSIWVENLYKERGERFVLPITTETGFKP